MKKLREIIIVIILLLISGLAHGVNMLHFPYYENDEGVYVSQAWSIVTSGKLAPYTYWYDHAPAGWILLALWAQLTGGFFTFGMSVNSGRVLMLVLHVISTYFLYRIARRLAGSPLAGIVAALFFALSPLGIYFQRRVLLDNIMTFWVLFSFYLLSIPKLKLRHIILSSITFGIAILSKENAIFFIPGFLVYLIFNSTYKHKRLAVVQWLTIAFLVTSLYFLYAFLKNELFPYGTLLGGAKPHVSLIDTFRFQLSRRGGDPTDPQSEFRRDLLKWINQDWLLMLTGAVTTSGTLLLSLYKRHYVAAVLLAIFFIYFLARGGEVIEFYVVPLIPIFGIVTGIVLTDLLRIVGRFKPRLSLAIAITIPVLLTGYYVFFHHNNRGFNIYTTDQTKAQIDAITWMRQNIADTSVVVIDNYGYVDLHAADNPGKDVYPHAEWYWKVDRDSSIKADVLHNNPASIDYIAMTPQMESDLFTANLSLLDAAFKQSKPVERIWHDGWGVEFWSTTFPQQVLTRSWESYKRNFMQSGRVIDPENNGVTTSEGQSYALLRAVWMGDQATFDQVWQWTKTNMQMATGVFGWNWGNYDGTQKLKDNGSAADGDSDIALALAQAYGRWHNPEYLSAARQVVNGIWETEVATVGGTNYLVAGNWAKDKPVAIINPSYFAPYAYRIFVQVDPTHAWNSLIDSSYVALSKCSDAVLDKNSSAGLAPNWCAMDAKGKAIASPEKGLDSTAYSYDAYRSTWRIALDYIWFNESRARTYLQDHHFLRSVWQSNHQILVGYTHDGLPFERYESAGAYGANIGNFIVVDHKQAEAIYQAKILGKFYENTTDSYWEDPKNYYEQNWAWFGTAMYANALTNYWHGI